MGKTTFSFDVAMLNSEGVFFPPDIDSSDARALGARVRHNVEHARVNGTLFSPGQIVEFALDHWPDAPGEKVQVTIQSHDANEIKCWCPRDNDFIYILKGNVASAIANYDLEFLIPQAPDDDDLPMEAAPKPSDAGEGPSEDGIAEGEEEEEEEEEDAMSEDDVLVVE